MERLFTRYKGSGIPHQETAYEFERRRLRSLDTEAIRQRCRCFQRQIAAALPD